MRDISVNANANARIIFRTTNGLDNDVRSVPHPVWIKNGFIYIPVPTRQSHYRDTRQPVIPASVSVARSDG
ncbi:hypothetical protein N7508_009322 [Penicillium antarcticum]|uniref:uncharacterized protein n=1 Tax=Penicillium antarcticum TaxID=416450 RepID=UPI002391C93F|nr:uncharacterized protein N7508_009322 [Penicillium antarcticum]KAJ5294501.1 hypothetical protein N7508_009322 [Penicillium antarcticum]